MSRFSLSPSAAAGAAGEAIQPEHAARRYGRSELAATSAVLKREQPAEPRAALRTYELIANDSGPRDKSSAGKPPALSPLGRLRRARCVLRAACALAPPPSGWRCWLHGCLPSRQGKRFLGASRLMPTLLSRPFATGEIATRTTLSLSQTRREHGARTATSLPPWTFPSRTCHFPTRGTRLFATTAAATGTKRAARMSPTAPCWLETTAPVRPAWHSPRARGELFSPT